MNVDDFSGDISIPLENFESIFLYLDIPSCLSISSTCKFFNFLNNTPYIWEERSKILKQNYQQLIEKGYLLSDLELESLLEPNFVLSTSIKPFAAKLTSRIFSSCLIVHPPNIIQEVLEEIEDLLDIYYEKGYSVREFRVFSSLEDAVEVVEDGGYIYMLRGEYDVDLEITKSVHIIGNMVKNSRYNNTLNSSIRGSIIYDCQEKSSLNHISLRGDGCTLTVNSESSLAFKRVIFCNAFAVHLEENSKSEFFRCNFIAGKIEFPGRLDRFLLLSSSIDSFNVELYQYIIVEARLILDSGKIDLNSMDRLATFIISIGNLSVVSNLVELLIESEIPDIILNALKKFHQSKVIIGACFTVLEYILRRVDLLKKTKDFMKQLVRANVTSYAVDGLKLQKKKLVPKIFGFLEIYMYLTKDGRTFDLSYYDTFFASFSNYLLQEEIVPEILNFFWASAYEFKPSVPLIAANANLFSNIILKSKNDNSVHNCFGIMNNILSTYTFLPDQQKLFGEALIKSLKAGKDSDLMFHTASQFYQISASPSIKAKFVSDGGLEYLLAASTTNSRTESHIWNCVSSILSEKAAREKLNFTIMSNSFYSKFGVKIDEIAFSKMIRSLCIHEVDKSVLVHLEEIFTKTTNLKVFGVACDTLIC